MNCFTDSHTLFFGKMFSSFSRFECYGCWISIIRVFCSLQGDEKYSLMKNLVSLKKCQKIISCFLEWLTNDKMMTRKYVNKPICAYKAFCWAIYEALTAKTRNLAVRPLAISWIILWSAEKVKVEVQVITSRYSYVESLKVTTVGNIALLLYWLLMIVKVYSLFFYSSRLVLSFGSKDFDFHSFLSYWNISCTIFSFTFHNI